jgi:hypothetical protein
MNICALITTCQRPEGLLRTLDALGDMPAIVLQDEPDHFGLREVIHQMQPDARFVWHLSAGQFAVESGRIMLVTRNEGPSGKMGYQHVINDLYEMASCTRYDHYIHLTDDIDFDPDWLEQVLKAYDGTRPLNICVNGRPSCWGFTSYVDGGFIAPRSAFEALNWTIEPISASRWKRNPKLGSGVWAQVTRRWHKLGIVPKMIARDPIRSSFDPSLSIMNPDRE